MGVKGLITTLYITCNYRKRVLTVAGGTLCMVILQFLLLYDRNYRLLVEVHSMQMSSLRGEKPHPEWLGSSIIDLWGME